jgi:hypothetical protein
VDQFGCRDVRLTDEPVETVPGEATQPGIIAGVLSGPDGFADELQSLADDAERPSAASSDLEPPLTEDQTAPVEADLVELATKFVRYAVDSAAGFPHAESVSFGLGGETVMAIDDISAALPNRKIWRACPADERYYAAADCPVDFLAPITAAVVNEESLVYSADPGNVTCAPTRHGPLPAGRIVVLRPEPRWRTCATDFALALAADDEGRLIAIDLTLAEP